MPVGLIFSQNKAQCNGIKSTALFFFTTYKVIQNQCKQREKEINE